MIGYKLLRADATSLRVEGRVKYPLDGSWITVPDNGAYVSHTGGLSAGGIGPLAVELECEAEQQVHYHPTGVRCWRRVRVVRHGAPADIIPASLLRIVTAPGEHEHTDDTPETLYLAGRVHQTGGVCWLYNTAEAYEQAGGKCYLHDSAQAHGQVGGDCDLYGSAQAHGQVGGRCHLSDYAQVHGQTGGVCLLFGNAQAHGQSGGRCYLFGDAQAHGQTGGVCRLYGSAQAHGQVGGRCQRGYREEDNDA